MLFATQHEEELVDCDTMAKLRRTEAELYIKNGPMLEPECVRDTTTKYARTKLDTCL